MSSSGVPVSSDCVVKFQDLKLKKKYTYIIYTLNAELTEIVVESTGKVSYGDFLELLPEDQCRWAIYDFGFEKEGAGQRNKIVFISWSPDDARIKQKMLFASSRDALKRAFTGLAIEVQGSDLSEVSYETVLEKANRGA